MIIDSIFMWLVAVPLTFLAAYVFKLPPIWVYFVMSLDELENCFCELNTAEDEYSLKLLSEEIDKFLDTLDKENRVIFIRRYWYADSITDVAERVSISEHNVTARLYRIRENLKKHLRKAGYSI